MSNEEMTDLLALDLGTLFENRNPYAKEIFNRFDIDLLPHSSEDTMLGEIYELFGGAWRTNNINIVGIIFSDDQIPSVVQQLRNVPKNNASIPDFVFDKKSIIELGLKIPSLYNISFGGDIDSATKLEVKINQVTKSRLTNTQNPGIDIIRTFSAFKESHTRLYRKNIKFEYLVESLFYAESVEILLEKAPDVNIGVGFQVEGVDVTVGVDTATKKSYTLKYSGQNLPFGATMVRGKNFLN